jgi:phosphopantothenate-cysteine ligase
MGSSSVGWLWCRWQNWTWWLSCRVPQVLCAGQVIACFAAWLGEQGKGKRVLVISGGSKVPLEAGAMSFLGNFSSKWPRAASAEVFSAACEYTQPSPRPTTSHRRVRPPAPAWSSKLSMEAEENALQGFASALQSYKSQLLAAPSRL